jgi:hypothetical protein
LELEVLDAKLDWLERRQSERHVETTTRLDRIETQVRETNGRVTRHDEQIRTLFRVRPKDVLTMGTVKIFAAFGGWVVAALLGALKLAGKL